MEPDLTRLGRHPERGSHAAGDVAAVLDAAPLCHVAFVDHGVPVCIPTLHVRVDDALYLHGSVKSRMMVRLGEGADVCVTATLLDGLVLARSAFHHSVNYRSVVVFGRAELVPLERRGAVLHALVDRLAAGRAAASRSPTAAELEATAVVRLGLDRASTKARRGPPIDAPRDLTWPVWAGVVPLALRAGAPEPAPDLIADAPAAPALAAAYGGPAVL